jgi:hypothetical protein
MTQLETSSINYLTIEELVLFKIKKLLLTLHYLKLKLPLMVFLIILDLLAETQRRLMAMLFKITIEIRV